MRARLPASRFASFLSPDRGQRRHRNLLYIFSSENTHHSKVYEMAEASLQCNINKKLSCNREAMRRYMWLTV